MTILDLSSLHRGGGAGQPADATQQRALTARGIIARAPASESDSMHVVLKGVSLDQGFEVVAGNWTPRGSALPAKGAECLIVFDDEGDACVPVWTGASVIDASEINGVALPLTDSAWIAPTLLNSWANYLPGTYEVAGYLKDPLGFVHLRGSIKSGASGSTAFVLPAGYRPVAGMQVPIVANGGSPNPPGGVFIDQTGVVDVYFSTSSTYVSLASVTFLAEN